MIPEVLIEDQGRWTRVMVRRKDGALAMVGGTGGADHRARAEEVAERFREALANGAEWALKVVDVSAGELRG